MTNVGDKRTGKTRVLDEPCPTCILRPQPKRIPLRPDRLKELIDSAVERDSYVVCHSTLPGSRYSTPPSVCRGFADRYDTAALRLIRRFVGFVEVALTPRAPSTVDGARRTRRSS